MSTNYVNKNEIREIFTLFDKSKSGKVATSELGTVARALNLNPTEAEIKEMQLKVDPETSGNFNVENLEKVIGEHTVCQEMLICK